MRYKGIVPSLDGALSPMAFYCSAPVQTLIDYMGFRLIALSILPVDFSTIPGLAAFACSLSYSGTLQYGSCDGGHTVLTKDDNLNTLMEQAAEVMHLKGHVVGLPGGSPKTVFGPVDIGTHKHIAYNLAG